MCEESVLGDAGRAAATAEAIDQVGRASEDERSPENGLQATIHALLIAVDVGGGAYSSKARK